MFRYRKLFGRVPKYLTELLTQLDSPYQVESLTPELLYSMGARAIVFDHDGVLGPNFSIAPDETGKMLLNRFIAEFGPNSIFIMSNTKSVKEPRKQHYIDEWPSLAWIDAAPKPDKEGLMIAQSISGVDVANIAVIDDGLLTGILMAIESGAIPLYARRKRLPENFYAKLARIATTWPQIVLVRLICNRPS